MQQLSSTRQVIDDYGIFISQLEEKHKNSSYQELTLPTKSSTEKIYAIESLKINDSSNSNLPFLLFIKEEIHNFIESGVLKSIDHRGLQEAFYEALNNEKLEELIELLFWLFLIIKYPVITPDEETYSRILKDYRRKISSNYVSFIIILPHHQKENLLNLVIFSVAYIILLIFCKHFPNEKAQISNRFLLDIFHIILFELNGVCVSDYYVQNIIEKMFTYKFLSFYKDYGSFKKPESPSRKPKNFLGNTINFPENPNFNVEYQSFSHELSSILYKNIDFSKKPRVVQKKEIKNEVYNNHYAHTDVSQMSVNKSSVLNNSTTSQNLEENTYMNKMKFDCSQISPTISNILENGKMTLPHIKRKVINHPIDKSIDNGIRLKYPLSLSKIPEKSPTQNKQKIKSSVLDPYNYTVNDLPDEYKTNSTHLKDLYQLKYILDNTHQNTFQLPSSKKMLLDIYNEKTKNEADYLLDKGYTPFCVDSLVQMKEKELIEKQKKESLKSNFNLKSTELEFSALSPGESPRMTVTGLSPKIASNYRIRKSIQLQKNFKVILNNSEKNEEKPTAYEIVPKRELRPTIYEKNMEFDNEKEKNRLESEALEIAYNQEGPKMFNYKDHRIKYREEHGVLIKGNIDTNINNLVNNIIEKKDAVRKMLKIVKHHKINPSKKKIIKPL